MTGLGSDGPLKPDRLFELSEVDVETSEDAALSGDETLLERSRAYWQMGEWGKLTALADDQLAGHRDRAKLSLLAAVGFAQLDYLSEARRHARQALNWGCNRELVARVLIAGVYNSLGRAASLQDDEARAVGFFENSVATVSPRADAKVLGRARNIHEKARMGQLPEAARLIEPEEIPAQIADLKTDHRTREDRLAYLEALVTGKQDQDMSLDRRLDQVRKAPPALPQTRLIVCGHHKAGTNFLLPVFRAISETFDLPLWMKFYDAEPEDWNICLHQHSRITDVAMDRNFRGVHLIRHPMGLVYSATLYHERCKEPWVHIPMERFTAGTFWALSHRRTYNQIKDPNVPLAHKQALLQTELPRGTGLDAFDSGYDMGGKTYAEMLAGFDTIEDKIQFEMRAFSRGVLYDMISFPADRRFFSLKLEEVSHDPQMKAVRDMLDHLGFAGPPAAECLDIIARHSLWNIERPAHATTGVSREWTRIFKGDLLRDFRELFGWAELAIGYEDD